MLKGEFKLFLSLDLKYWALKCLTCFCFIIFLSCVSLVHYLICLCHFCDKKRRKFIHYIIILLSNLHSLPFTMTLYYWVIWIHSSSLWLIYFCFIDSFLCFFTTLSYWSLSFLWQKMRDSSFIISLYIIKWYTSIPFYHHCIVHSLYCWVICKLYLRVLMVYVIIILS